MLKTATKILGVSFLVVALFSTGPTHGLSSGIAEDERYKLGKEKFETITRESQMPRYSACWTSALNLLDHGCKKLTDDMQHRLAFKFTNCFLQKTGRRTYECEETAPLEQCTGSMTSEAYNTYTEFFTHTQNICFFLQAQVWQEATDGTISRLTENSEVVAQQIEDSGFLQAELLKQQNESIKNQEVLLATGSELQRTIEDSSTSVNKLLLDFKETTSEQRTLIFEVFDRVNSLQSVMMGEFTGFYSLIFYTISVLISYLLTSTPRTSEARFWLFVLMTVNIVFERLIAFWGAQQYQDLQGNFIDENSQIYNRLWYSRKVSSSLAVLVWMACAFRFKDYNKINNHLLIQIQKQNSDLKHLLSSAHPSSPAIPPSSLHDETQTATVYNKIANQKNDWDNLLMKDEVDASRNDNSTTGYETDTDDDSECSLDSKLTDRTFVCPADASDSDTESCASYATRQSSRAVTPALLEELRFLRQTTPVREMLESSHISCLNHSSASIIAGAEEFSQSKKRAPPRGRRSMPVQETATVPCRYNLRNRRRTLGVPPNPLVEDESALQFGRMVKHLSQVAQRNSVKTKVTVQRIAQHERSLSNGNAPNFTRTQKPPTFFSSDED